MIIESKPNDRIKTPTGLQKAVCSKVIDIGLQKVIWQTNEKIVHQMIILFELDERIKGGEYDGQRFIITKKYTVSLHEKSNLLKDINMWRGKPLTEEERKGFDTEKLVGVNCMLTITEDVKPDGRVFEKIAAISPMPKEMNKITPELVEIPAWITKLIENQYKQPTKEEEDIF